MENNNGLMLFSYNGRQLRTVLIDDDVWFVAKDVCDILELSDVSMATRRLDDDEKGTSKVCTLGGIQDMTVISESGLYTLTLRSNKDEAKNFRRCVTHEILPSIRKHGAYITPAKMQEIIQDPDVWIHVLQALKGEQQKVRELQAQAEQDKPKVIFAESVEASKNSILIRELAKLLRQNGYMVGQNRLFAELRERGYLIKCGADYNMPTQKSMELGLMEVLTRTVNRGDGEIKLCKTPKITGKGQVYFINLFLGKK